MYMRHLDRVCLLLLLCVCVPAKIVIFIKWHLVLALYLQWGNCVVLLQGCREHQRRTRTSGKSYLSTLFFIQNAHINAIPFDICIPNETSAIGAEYMKQAGEERERDREENSNRGRIFSPLGSGQAFISSFHLYPILQTRAHTHRLSTLFSLI